MSVFLTSKTCSLHRKSSNQICWYIRYYIWNVSSVLL